MENHEYLKYATEKTEDGKRLFEWRIYYQNARENSILYKR
jgi:hypothetical protein